MEKNPFCVVLSTYPEIETAKQVAYDLVQKKLAACVNIVPSITSVYAWENKMCEGQELLLIIKTTREKVEAIEGLISTNHPYSLAEIIVLPIIGGSNAYLSWAANCVGHSENTTI